MKKAFNIISLFLFLFTLSSCIDPENTAPVITGQDTLQLMKNDALPDWKTYITATDVEDGDLTITDDMVNDLDSYIDHVGFFPIIFTVTDSGGLSTTHEMMVEILESFDGTFELLGDVEITLEVGDTYTEPGVTALDAEDNVLTHNTYGEVNTSVLGTYSIDYTIDESDTRLTRTVHVVDRTAPELSTYEFTTYVGSDFIDFSDYAIDNYDTDVEVTVSGPNYNNTSAGAYEVHLALRDSSDNETSVHIIVNVEIALANGTYFLQKLPYEKRAELYYELENYLLTYMYAGIPLYHEDSFVVYSDRVLMFTETYSSVFEYGIEFASLSLDDSNILIEAGVNGNTNEFTFRDSYMHNLSTLNNWDMSSSYDEVIISQYNGSLYRFDYVSETNGYQLVPSLAFAEPVAVNPPEQDDNPIAKTWRIELNTDMKWNFHPDYDTSVLSDEYETLDAEDFIWTWQQALVNSWDHAVSGGGDFLSSDIKGVQEFLDGDISITEVGLRVAEDNPNIIEIEFNDYKKAYDVMFMFSNSRFSPVNKDMYEVLGGYDNYAQTPITTPSSGAYILTEFTPSDRVVLMKNDLHPESDTYQYDYYQYNYYENSDQVLDAFLAGLLDTASVPFDRSLEVTEYTNLYKITSDSLWRLNFNAFGTVEARDVYISEHPDEGINETYIPEPILQYTDMRTAMYFGIDREAACAVLSENCTPENLILPDTFILDYLTGETYRASNGGTFIGEVNEFSGYGYEPELARMMFNQAIEQAISDGHYTSGTTETPTVITLDLYYAENGNPSRTDYLSNIETQLETVLVSEQNHVEVDIVLHDVDYPAVYGNHIQTANMDLGFGAISGAVIRPYQVMTVFNDDNVTGLTLNWGIDTHSPVILITYVDNNGNEFTELWSYNALAAALVGTVEVTDGVLD